MVLVELSKELQLRLVYSIPMITTPSQHFNCTNLQLATSRGCTSTLQHSKENDQEAEVLEERHKMSRTVLGTQRLHSFVPLSACMVEVRQFSSSPIFRAERVVQKDIHCTSRTAISIGGYVTVVYNDACWLGYMLAIDRLSQ